MRPLFSVFNVASALLLALAYLVYSLVGRPPALPQAPVYRTETLTPQNVTIYYSDSQVLNLVRQTREIKVLDGNLQSRSQAAVTVWASGPAGQGGVAVVPAKSEVPQVWVRGPHYLVNLPASYSKLNYGSSGERMLLCTLTRTLLALETTTKDVTFLVAGKNSDTLLGHADLRAPWTAQDCSDS